MGAAQGPRRHFWLLPLCCCSSCTKPHDLAVQHLLFLFVCIKQFFWVTVFYAIATLHLEIAEPRFPHAQLVLQVLMKTSTALVIWALLVLVRSSSVIVGDMNFFYEVCVHQVHDRVGGHSRTRVQRHPSRSRLEIPLRN